MSPRKKVLVATLAVIAAVAAWDFLMRSERSELPNGYAYVHFRAGGHKYLISPHGIKVVGQEVLAYRVDGDKVLGLVRKSLGHDEIRSFLLNTKTGMLDESAASLIPGSGRQDASEDVPSLVAQLVSPEPAKYPSGEHRIFAIEEYNGFTHPRVERARLKLVAMGTAIYPELVAHLHDDRYSRSIISAAWLNMTVGDTISDIMAEGVVFSGYGYKSRPNPRGSNGEPSFHEMARGIGWEAYAMHAAKRSKSELQKEFVTWKLAQERKHGFVDAEQEAKITQPYLKWLAEH